MWCVLGVFVYWNGEEKVCFFLLFWKYDIKCNGYFIVNYVISFFLLKLNKIIMICICKMYKKNKKVFFIFFYLVYIYILCY